jgi:hypothetical protein
MSTYGGHAEQSAWVSARACRSLSPGSPAHDRDSGDDLPSRETSATTGAYCPHCFLLVEGGAALPWPRAATRCPHCRLMIGPGRARGSAEAKPGARGTAAGVFAHEARREDEAPRASEEAVLSAIRLVAGELGHRPERLLMVDYQQRASTDPELPDLSQVFAAFGSWKRARREAAGS